MRLRLRFRSAIRFMYRFCRPICCPPAPIIRRISPPAPSVTFSYSSSNCLSTSAGDSFSLSFGSSRISARSQSSLLSSSATKRSRSPSGRTGCSVVRCHLHEIRTKQGFTYICFVGFRSTVCSAADGIVLSSHAVFPRVAGSALLPSDLAK